MNIARSQVSDNDSKLNYPPLTSSKRQTWVQTERAAHEAWGHLVSKSPRAAALMHHLVAHMDQSAAVVASHATLAAICQFSVATVKRAIDDLTNGNWIQVVNIGGKGASCAYVVNSRVAWAAPRGMLPMAVFNARVLALADDQDKRALDGPALKRMPVLRHGELQLPMGPGETPPAQPSLGGLEHDLPSIQDELEARGQLRLDQ